MGTSGPPRTAGERIECYQSLAARRRPVAQVLVRDLRADVVARAGTESGFRRGSMSRARRVAFVVGAVVAIAVTPHHVTSAATAKPPLHGRHWVAITGKPFGTTAGTLFFAQGGNAVQPATAMLAATTT